MRHSVLRSPWADPPTSVLRVLRRSHGCSRRHRRAQSPRQPLIASARTGHSTYAGFVNSENLRASDADREKIVNRLRLAMDEGRLSLHEFDERLQQVYAAKTHGDLVPLTSDLPAQRPECGTRPADAGIPTWIKIMWTPWVFVNLLCVVIWLATGLGYFWPFWVMAPWGLALLIPTTIGIISARDQRRRRA
ncbi:DUF1707 domain-containing protein [Nocardia otitidiscaviarum]|nr:DUF1707 domain-containing protein [Nocardia otitidiscaviarum]